MIQTTTQRWIKYYLPSFLSNHLTYYPTPANINYWWSFGSLAGLCLIIQIVTGILLAMHYIPHIDLAFLSIEHIMRNVQHGWLMRYIHANGASMFFLAVYLHIFRGLFYGSFSKPNHLLWISGVVLFFLMIMTAFMGYVLPWGQMSFWAATVITNLFSAIPLIGEAIVYWLWGGFSVDNPTLNRFYSLHYLLPFIIAAVAFIHLIFLHYNGSTNPLGVETKLDRLTFHPYFYVKDLFAFCCFMFLFGWFVFFAPNFLGHPDNYIPANPLVTPLHIVPEWYFLPFYAILRSIPNKLGGVFAMVLAIFVLFALPFYNMKQARSSLFQPFYQYIALILTIIFIILGQIGSLPADQPYVKIGQWSTVCYFIILIYIIPYCFHSHRYRDLREEFQYGDEMLDYVCEDDLPDPEDLYLLY
jgi:ubiquinol-cytochrome c reductase cytochrome b subunit